MTGFVDDGQSKEIENDWSDVLYKEKRVLDDNSSIVLFDNSIINTELRDKKETSAIWLNGKYLFYFTPFLIKMEK